MFNVYFIIMLLCIVLSVRADMPAGIFSTVPSLVPTTVVTNKESVFGFYYMLVFLSVENSTLPIVTVILVPK